MSDYTDQPLDGDECRSGDKLLALTDPEQWLTEERQALIKKVVAKGPAIRTDPSRAL